MKLNKLREEMAQSFIDALKEDRIPWEQGWQSQDRPRNAVSDKSLRWYSKVVTPTLRKMI